MDSSVVAKWVLPGEPYEENAVKLKQHHVSGIASLIAPVFITLEVANSLWKAVKLGRIIEEDAQEALKALNDMGIKLHESNWVQASEALNIACKLNLTIYDASYLSLTYKTKAQFITADNKLCEKAEKHFRVLHIKNYL